MTTLKHAIVLAQKNQSRTGKTMIVYKDIELNRGEDDYFYTDILTWNNKAIKYGKIVKEVNE